MTQPLKPPTTPNRIKQSLLLLLVLKIKQDNSQNMEETQEEALSTESKSSLLPFLLLLSGSVLFVFGVALVLFSMKDFFTLQWNASYCLFT